MTTFTALPPIPTFPATSTISKLSILGASVPPPNIGVGLPPLLLTTINYLQLQIHFHINTREDDTFEIYMDLTGSTPSTTPVAKTKNLYAGLLNNKITNENGKMIMKPNFVPPPGKYDVYYIQTNTLGNVVVSSLSSQCTVT